MEQGSGRAGGLSCCTDNPAVLLHQKAALCPALQSICSQWDELITSPTCGEASQVLQGQQGCSSLILATKGAFWSCQLRTFPGEHEGEKTPRTAILDMEM